MRKLPRNTEKDTPPYTDDDTHMRPDHGAPPSRPGWVKVFWIIGLGLLLLLVILHLTGNSPFGHHGMQQP